MNDREVYLTDLQLRIEQNKAMLSGWNKIVESDISMADILAYLNEIQSQHGTIKFNLTFVKDVASSDYGYKLFTLTGEGDWESIFAMIWILENGRRIFTIDKLGIRGVETMEEDNEPPYYTRFRMVVPFSLQIRAIYSKGAVLAKLPEGAGIGFLPQLPVGRNLFYPGIIRSLPPNDAGLLEAERAELKAIFPGKAIIADHLGNLHSLAEGDPVYLGYLLNINQPLNSVEFLLNKGGIVEKLSLKMLLGIDPVKIPG